MPRIILAFGVCLLLASVAPAGGDKPTPSALESDPKGWTDVMPPADFKGWKRVPLPVGSKLKEESCWKVDAANKVLLCNGVGVHENLQLEKELGDFIFHVEWRFKKVEGKKGYNSGVYVRNSADGGIWHQAQVGSLNVGFIFGDSLVDGKKMRVRHGDTKPQRGKEAGEWNVYEITCKGKEVTLWVNGFQTAKWTDCQVPKGQIGLEAEGFEIEFRNLKVKELK
jgi:hypothetical protein